MNEIINYSAVSELLSGNKTLIRKNKCPKKHKQRIGQLKHYVECWTNGVDMYTKTEVLEKVKQSLL